MPSPITVLAVDDRAVFLRATRELIAAAPGFRQVGEAASGSEALELAADLHPDLVLLDMRMPGMDGIETARRLLASDPQTLVVLVSLDEIPPAPFASLRKQDLSTRALRQVWDAHGRQTPAHNGAGAER
ncbi:MAG: response regulator [Actinobacteria bacterium]|nr:MAG: response regulator [Actinomycetota bacterium]